MLKQCIAFMSLAILTNVCWSIDIPIKTVNKVIAKKVVGGSFQTGSYKKVDTDSKASAKPEIAESAEICEALIQKGKQFEAANELEQAMDCYKAAALMNAALAENAIVALETKMQDETERRRQEEELLALQRGAKQGNAADAYKLGKIYYSRNNVDDAVKMWVLASENKHPKAPYRLAVMYEKGDKVSVDFAKAEKFYRIGANNGHPECAYVTSKLMEINLSGKPGVEEEAFTMKKEAANRGHAVAAAEVGYIYASKGEHVKARQYFEKAKKYATPNSTMTVSVRQIMNYNIAAENTQMLRQ
jgi:tetratricopeptide (TPR) repeat protein